MQVMLGMLPMLVKEMKGGKGERISTAKGSRRRSGGKGGKDLWEEKRSLSRGEQANGGTGSQTGKGEKDFGKRRVESLGGKGLRWETGEKGDELREKEGRKGGERSLGGKGRRTEGRKRP